MRLHRATIQYVAKVHDEAYRMGVTSPGITEEVTPGQFYMVRTQGGLDPFLPRPFAVHRKWLQTSGPQAKGSGLEIFFQVVGRGTWHLSRRSPGEPIDVIGPLGKGWQVPEGLNPILVAGGVGVAPFVALAEEMSQRCNRQMNVFLGAFSPDRLWCVEDLKGCGATVQTAAETGQHAFQGTVFDLLLHHWNRVRWKSPLLLVCGPPGMLKTVAVWALQEGIPCQVSLESPMACGLGICLGCAVKAAGSERYLHVCKDGPVLNADEIDWSAWDAHTRE